MTVELHPFGVRCNLPCPYGDQHPQRDAANVAGCYDPQKKKRTITSTKAR